MVGIREWYWTMRDTDNVNLTGKPARQAGVHDAASRARLVWVPRFELIHDHFTHTQCHPAPSQPSWPHRVRGGFRLAARAASTTHPQTAAVKHSLVLKLTPALIPKRASSTISVRYPKPPACPPPPENAGGVSDAVLFAHLVVDLGERRGAQRQLLPASREWGEGL